MEAEVDVSILAAHGPGGSPKEKTKTLSNTAPDPARNADPDSLSPHTATATNQFSHNWEGGFN